MSQTSPLENLAGPGKPLHKEPPDQSEINGLIGSGNARLVADLIVAVKRVADALSNA